MFWVLLLKIRSLIFNLLLECKTYYLIIISTQVLDISVGLEHQPSRHQCGLRTSTSRFDTELGSSQRWGGLCLAPGTVCALPRRVRQCQQPQNMIHGQCQCPLPLSTTTTGESSTGFSHRLLVRSASSDEQMVAEAGRLVGAPGPLSFLNLMIAGREGPGSECLLCRRMIFQGPKPGALAITLPHCIFSCSDIPGGWPSSKDQQVLLDSIPGASETAQ